MIPTGMPSVVEPAFDRKSDLEAVKKNVIGLKDFLPWDDYEWWMRFFENKATTVEANSDVWYLQHLLPFHVDPVEANHLPDVQSPLAVKMQKEREIPKVNEDLVVIT